jgi:hypothetical protein
LEGKINDSTISPSASPETKCLILALGAHEFSDYDQQGLGKANSRVSQGIFSRFLKNHNNGSESRTQQGSHRRGRCDNAFFILRKVKRAKK